jgi:hypothetical protein
MEFLQEVFKFNNRVWEKELQLEDLPSLSGLSAQSLTKGVLEEFEYDVTKDFNSVFEAAPVLPRPLPSYIPCAQEEVGHHEGEDVALSSAPQNYRFIHLESLIAEVRAAAPGCKVVPRPGVTEDMRRLSQLRLLYLKAREYSDIHYILYLEKQKSADKNAQLITFLTMGVTAILYVFGTSYMVLVASISALVTIYVSTLNSWSQFKKYEEEAQAHKSAFRGFESIADRIGASLDTVRSVSSEMNKDLKGLLVMQPPSQRAQQSPGLSRKLYAMLVPQSVKTWISSRTKQTDFFAIALNDGDGADNNELANNPLYVQYRKVRAVLDFVLLVMDESSATSKIHRNITGLRSSPPHNPNARTTVNEDGKRSATSSAAVASKSIALETRKFTDAAHIAAHHVEAVRAGTADEESVSRIKGVLKEQHTQLGKTFEEEDEKIAAVLAAEECRVNGEMITCLKSMMLEQLPVDIFNYFENMHTVLARVFTDPEEIRKIEEDGTMSETKKLDCRIEAIERRLHSATMATANDHDEDGGEARALRVIRKITELKSHRSSDNGGSRGGDAAAAANDDDDDGGSGGSAVISAITDPIIKLYLYYVPQSLAKILRVAAVVGNCPELKEWGILQASGGLSADQLEAKKRGIVKHMVTRGLASVKAKLVLAVAKILHDHFISPLVGGDDCDDSSGARSAATALAELREKMKASALTLNQQRDIVNLFQLTRSSRNLRDLIMTPSISPTKERNVASNKGVRASWQLGSVQRANRKVIDVANLDYFSDQVGNQVIIRSSVEDGDDAAVAEIRTIIGLGSIILDQPLHSNMPSGTHIMPATTFMHALEALADENQFCKDIPLVGVVLSARRLMHQILFNTVEAASVHEDLLQQEGRLAGLMLWKKCLSLQEAALKSCLAEMKRLVHKSGSKVANKGKSLVGSECFDELAQSVERELSADTIAMVGNSLAVNPIAMLYMSSPQRLTDLLTSESAADAGDHYGIRDALELFGVRTLLNQGLKDKSAVSAAVKSQLQDPSKLLSLLADTKLAKKDRVWNEAKGLLISLPAIITTFVVQHGADTLGGERAFSHPTTLVRSLLCGASAKAEVKSLLDELKPFLAFFLAPSVKSVLSIYSEVFFGRRRDGEKGGGVDTTLRRCIVKNFSRVGKVADAESGMPGYLNNIEAATGTVDEIFTSFFHKKSIIGETLFRELIPYMKEELTGRTHQLLDLPEVIKSDAVPALLRSGFLDTEEVSATAWKEIIAAGIADESTVEKKKKQKDGGGKVGAFILDEMQRAERSAADGAKMTGKLWRVVAKALTRRLGAIATMGDVKTLFQALPADALYLIGGPMLGAIAASFDHFATTLRSVNQQSISSFMQDPLTALQKAEKLVVSGAKKAGNMAVDEVKRRLAEDGDDVASSISTNGKLQVIYRRSIEYSAAHQILAQKNRALHHILSFLTLCSATATSLLLFSSSNSDNEAAAETAQTNDTGETWGSLAASVTTMLTITKDFMNLSDVSNAHEDSALAYLDLVHRVKYLLVKQSEDDQNAEYMDISSRFYEVRQMGLALPLPKLMDAYLKPRETGEGADEPFFEVIIDDSLRFEHFAKSWFPRGRTGKRHPLQDYAALFIREFIDKSGISRAITNVIYACMAPRYGCSAKGGRTSNRILPVFMEEEVASDNNNSRSANDNNHKSIEARYLSQETKEKLWELQFLDKFDSIEAEFSSAESSMPPVPYDSLAEYYNFISWRSILRHAKREFPLMAPRRRSSSNDDDYAFHDNDDDDTSGGTFNALPLEARDNLFNTAEFIGKTRAERMLLMLHRMFCMSAEYVLLPSPNLYYSLFFLSCQ